MSTVFLKILNMSIAASWLIAVVLLVRFLLKKAPKWISCVLWALVALRLMIPFSFQSPLSLLPSGETITYKTIEDTQNDDSVKAAEPGASVTVPVTPSEGSERPAPRTKIPVIDSGIKVIDNALNPVIEQAYRTENKTSAQTTPSTPSTNVVSEDPAAQEAAPAPAAEKTNPLKTWTLIAAIVWIAGTAGLLIYALVSYLILRKKVSASVPLWGNIRAADGIRTPFILGILKPVIYVPSTLQGEGLDYVLAHEEAHLRRRDHLWKPLGYLLLSVYWFNPLCWLAYILLCRDIESACDEKAVRFMNHEEMAEYSQTLLNLSIQRHQIVACPVAFGEVNVKQRIKNVLNYKKPAFCVVLVALIACIAVAGCFLTDPKKETDPSDSEAQTTENATDPTKEPTEEPSKEPSSEPTDPSKETDETEPAGRETVTDSEFYALMQNSALSDDMFSWFFENVYNGEKVQVLPYWDQVTYQYGSNPVGFKGAVFYRADAGQSFDEVLYAMEDAICRIFTEEENRKRTGYVMTDYHIYPQDNLKAVGENVWDIPHLEITYKYDGKDFGASFEEMKADSKVDEYGLIPCFAQGSENVFQFIVVKQEDVYFLTKLQYVLSHPEGEIYQPENKGGSTEPDTSLDEARIVVLEEPEILFTIPVNQGEDSLRGVILGRQDPTPDYDPSTERYYEFGPNAFALRNEEDLFILDQENQRILHFRKGVETESLALNVQGSDLYGHMILHEDNVYTVTYDGVIRWNYVTGKTAFFPGGLNPLQRDFYVADMVWQGGLVLVNPAGTNLKLDELTGTFTETKDGYTTERDSLSSLEFVVKGYGRERIIPKEESGFAQIAGQGPRDSLFVVSSVENKDGEYAGKYDYYLHLYGSPERSYTQAPELLSIQLPTEMIWWLPHHTAYVDHDGVYVFLVEKDYAYVVKYISFEYGPEPYESKPVDSARIDLTFDSVLKKGERLSKDEYQRIQGEFFSRDYSQYPWNFIKQSYNDPSEIDLLLLFRDGTDRDLPEEECIAAWTAADLLDWRLGPQKRSKESVRELFVKYTGQEPTDEQMKAFSQWLYLPEYDAYYSFVTDADEDLRVREFGTARKLSAQDAKELGLPVQEDGMIAMNWKGGHPDFAIEGMVLLIPEGDSYRIAANLVLGMEAKASFEYVPGEVTVEMKTEGGKHFINLSPEDEQNLEEYFRLRALERTDPLGVREALEASSLFRSSEIDELLTKRSIRCMDQINAIQASFARVAVTFTIQSLWTNEYELFIQCKEDYTIDYQYKDSVKTDRMQEGSVMTIVMERSHIVPAEYARYSLTMSYGGVLDEALDEETVLQEYRTYREDHPVTNELIEKAKTQISEQLMKRLEKAVEEGTWGMEGYKKEDIPNLLIEVWSYLSGSLEEEKALQIAMSGSRMPFRQYKAIFAMNYEMSVTDTDANKTMTPFGRYTRVFFFTYDGALEYLDIPEGGF